MKVSAAGFDGWAHPGTDQLCAPCHWGRVSPELRATSWLITSHPSLTPVPREELTQVLRSAIDRDHALAVVLRARRKHVLPAARWGHVAVDDIPVRWGPREVELFEVTAHLRRLGVSRAEMNQDALPWRVLQNAGPAAWSDLQDTWEALRPWRRPQSPLMTLALFATDPLRATR